MCSGEVDPISDPLQRHLSYAMARSVTARAGPGRCRNKNVRECSIGLVVMLCTSPCVASEPRWDDTAEEDVEVL